VEERFFGSVQTGPGAHPASYIMVTKSFPGVKGPRFDVDHPTPPSDKVKEKSTAIPLLPLWYFVACCRVKFIFTVSLRY
jgi:hypothetical protein